MIFGSYNYCYGRILKLKLVLPKEHGAWAMWIAPFIVGIGVTDFQSVHLLLFISLFFVYIALSPFLQGFRRPMERRKSWQLSLTYLVYALIPGFPIVIYYPKLLYIPLFITPLLFVAIYFVMNKNERALTNDLIGIAALNTTFFASYYISALQYDVESVLLWSLQIALFFGSALYVKTIIREKNNKTFKWITNIYMLLLPVFAYLFFGPLVMIAYLFSTIRALLTPSGSALTPKKVGIIEIINTSWFVLFIIIAFS